MLSNPRHVKGAAVIYIYRGCVPVIIQDIMQFKHHILPTHIYRSISHHPDQSRDTQVDIGRGICLVIHRVAGPRHPYGNNNTATAIFRSE